MLFIFLSTFFSFKYVIFSLPNWIFFDLFLCPIYHFLFAKVNFLWTFFSVRYIIFFFAKLNFLRIFSRLQICYFHISKLIFFQLFSLSDESFSHPNSLDTSFSLSNFFILHFRYATLRISFYEQLFTLYLDEENIFPLWYMAVFFCPFSFFLFFFFCFVLFCFCFVLEGVCFLLFFCFFVVFFFKVVSLGTGWLRSVPINEYTF